MWYFILALYKLNTNFVLIRNLIADHVVAMGHQHICITFKFIWHKHQGRENALINLSQSIFWCECKVNSWTNIYQHLVFYLTVQLVGCYIKRFTCIYSTVLWSCGCYFFSSNNCLCVGIIINRPPKQMFFWLVMQSSPTVMGQNCQCVMEP